MYHVQVTTLSAQNDNSNVQNSQIYALCVRLSVDLSDQNWVRNNQIYALCVRLSVDFFDQIMSLSAITWSQVDDCANTK